MTNKNNTNKTYIIPFEQLGTELAKEDHWTKSFGTGIGTGSDQFTIERENFGDANSPMLTQVISDDGMADIAKTLGGWHGRHYADFASSFEDEFDEFDGPYQAFMDSSEGEQVWQDYERLVHGLVPYLDELDTGRFVEGDRVFNLANHHYGTVSRLEGDTVQLDDDGTAADAFYLLKPSDKIFQ
jgi:hypothetical protein